MTEAKRRNRHAQEFADKLYRDVGGECGWIIVSSRGTSWYGFYPDADYARSRIGKLDSLDMPVQGTVVYCGKRDAA